MDQRTVIVVGAGASKEVGLPTGPELKKSIASLLDMRVPTWEQECGDPAIFGALENKAQADGPRGDINSYLREAHHIRDALPLAISIDNLLDSQRENPKFALCGKLAICRAILEAEADSLLLPEEPNRHKAFDYSRLEGTWYLPFFQLLTENCQAKDLQDRFSSVALIIFNYDRCVEHFLFSALRDYYKLSADDAANITNAIDIYHPYGSVGPLPWQNMKLGSIFGAWPQPHDLLVASERIRTFTEGTDPDASEIIAIRECMRSASRVVFMGFAFHRLNMQLISPNGRAERLYGPDCFATVLGILIRTKK
jgi:hypothetical protein